MVVRVTILAKDIVHATEVVEFALGKDCALEEYTQVESPLSPTKKKVKIKKRKYVRKVAVKGHAQLRIVAGHYFQSPDSIRAMAYDTVQKSFGQKKLKFSDIVNALVGKGWTDQQSRSVLAGLRKVGAIVEVK